MLRKMYVFGENVPEKKQLLLLRLTKKAYTQVFPIIPHNCGVEELSFWIEKHPESLHLRFSKGFAPEKNNIRK